MSKNRGGDPSFNNRACKKFKDNPKIDLLSQDEIFDILDEDVTTILKQLTDARNHTGKYPTYTGQMFANLSTTLYFYYHVKEHVKSNRKKGKLKTDLTEDELISLKDLLANIYKRSATNQYANQQQEFADRNKLLAKTFEMLDPKGYKIAKKLGLKRREIRDLLIQVYGDPAYNMRYVHKLVNGSASKDKKKLKILKKLYGDRFPMAVGAAMTVESTNSDCLAMLYDYMMSKKLKKRAPFVRAYADAYKLNGKHYHRINAYFGRKNRKLIKELKSLDIGYKKAFANLQGDPKTGKKVAKKHKKDETDVALEAVKRKPTVGARC